MERGMSPIIGAVVLIMMIMVIASGVFLWMRSSVTKAEEEALVQQECQKIEFVLDDFCYEEELIPNLETEPQLRNYIRFNGRNDAEEPELYGFLIFIDYEGSTISIQSSIYSEIEGYDSKSVTSDFIEDIENIKQIRVVPKIKDGTRVFICEEKEKKIHWEAVEPC